MTFALIAQFVCIRIVFSIPSFDLSVTQPVSTLKLEQDQIESRYGSCKSINEETRERPYKTHTKRNQIKDFYLFIHFYLGNVYS